MATGAHVLRQQSGSLETRIKLLINHDLKEICKAYNYQVSGKKDALQRRCIEILNEIVKRGDEVGFQELNYRVQHHGQPPPLSHSSITSSSGSTTQTNGSYNNYNSMAPRAPAASRVTGGKNFKASPFYDVLETVVPLQDLPAQEMPQNRHTVHAQLILSADQVTRLKSDSELRLLLYCGPSQGMSQYHPADVAFPNQLEVKINGDDVRANFKGLKNKPGSTKPADITDKVRKANNYPNKLAVTYALTTKRYAYVVHLVRYINVEKLTERIRTGKHGGGVIRKEHVLNEMNKANADADIAATSTRMSLKDPISTLRITLPVRSSVCKHNQCFDGKFFMDLQDQAPQWTCPVCSNPVTYESLCVDQYFEEILREAEKRGSSIEKVDIEPDGRYRLLSEEDITRPPGHSSKGGRATYDDDFDDDLVEVGDILPKPPTNGISVARQTPSLLSPAPATSFVINTPPLSSRGGSMAPSSSSVAQSNKRPASAIIDLTLSDDEDEPPRPAKRQSMSTQLGNTAQYSTPTSLPDHRFSSYPSGPGQDADSYRQSSNPKPAVNNTNGGFGSFGNNSNNNTMFGSGSTWRSGSNNTGPSYATFGSVSNEARPSGNSWAGQNSRPSSGHGGIAPVFPSFAIRPLPTDNLAPSGNGSNGVRLPPMQPQPPNGFASGWRGGSGYSDYSQSPPG